MKKTISLALATLLLVFAFSSAACAAFANGSQAIVSTRSGKLNMRSGASGAYPIIDRLANGTTVTIVSQSGNWYCVSVGGRTGYVSADYLRANPNDPGSTELTPGTVPGTNNNPAQTVLGAKAYVSTSGGSLNMRVSPSAAGGVVRRLPNGAQVTIQEKVGDWYRVSYGSSQGYVMGSYLRVTQTGGSTGGNTTPGGTTGGNTTTGGSVAYVNTTSGSLNMRDAAGGRVIAQIARGTQVTVLSQTGRWSRIIANGQTGYVMTSYLSSSMPGAQNPGGSQSNISARVTSAQYLRLQPEDTASPVTQLGANAVVTVRNYGTEWCYVSFGGYTGYVRTSALNFANQGGAATQPTVTSRTSVNYTAYAQTDVSLLRIYPDAGADVSRSSTVNVAKNALVTVTQRATTSDNVVWLYIQTGYTTGWIRQGDLALRAADGSTVLPGASGGGSTAYVNTSGGSLNMRASIGGSVIAQLPRGTQVTVVSQTNGWSYISVNGRNGYVSSRYLSSTNGSSGSTGGAGGMGALNSSLDNMPAFTNSAQYLRSEPNSNSSYTTSIPSGASLTIRTYGSNWCLVVYGSLSGYIPTNSMRFAPQGGGAGSGTQGVIVTNTVNVNYTAYAAQGNGQLRIYGEPAGSSSAYASIAVNTAVQVTQRATTSDNRVWLKISIKGVSGWILQGDLALSSTNPGAGAGSGSTTVPPIGSGATVENPGTGTGTGTGTGDAPAGLLDWINRQQGGAGSGYGAGMSGTSGMSDIDRLILQQMQQGGQP